MNRLLTFSLLAVALLMPSAAQAQVTVLLSEESEAFPVNPNADLGLPANIEGMVRRPDISTNGRYIGLEVAVGSITSQDDTAVVIDLQTGSQTVIAQQGVTVLDGNPIGFIADAVRVNNSGQAALHAGGSVTGFWNGTTLSALFVEGDTAPAGAPRVNYGNDFDLAQLTNAGLVGGRYDSEGSAGVDRRDDFLAVGSTVLATANSTFPGYANQGTATGLSESFLEFDLSPDGTNWIANMRFDDTPTNDTTITVNGTVVAQERITEHTTPDGTVLTYSTITDLAINDSGDWITQARAADGTDYTLVNGVVIFAEDELALGQTEPDPSDPDAPERVTFSSMGGVSINSNGDYVSLWNTSDGNGIFILNDDTIILSEGTVLNVDYDGDGVSEDLVVRTYPTETFNLSDDGTLTLIVSFNDLDENQVGNALVAFNVNDPLTGPSVLLGDVNLDMQVNFSDISPFIAVLASNGFQLEADIDGSGEVNFADISPFIAILAAP